MVLDIPNQINTLKKEKLLRVVKSVGLVAKSENSIKAAFKNISKEDKNAIIFCTGSLYFAGEILNLN